MPDDTAAATITANTDPWVRALDKASAAMGGWVGKVESSFAAVSASVAAKTTAMIAKIGELAEGGLTGEKLGGAIGQSLGAVVGTALGPVGGRSSAGTSAG